MWAGRRLEPHDLFVAATGNVYQARFCHKRRRVALQRKPHKTPGDDRLI
jgi:hypothetical protein